MNNKLVFVFCIFFSVQVSVFSQIRIQGKVSDTLNKPLPNSAVVINNPKTDETLNFGFTNEYGRYDMLVNSYSDSLNIHVRSLGFTDSEVRISNKSQTKNFVLKPGIVQLKPVVIEKPPPISQIGDTLNYDIKSFSRKEDRTIRDVISRLPGIQISQDGQISYQGKPINKFYVEDLDLMGGRYNLITNNLVPEVVDKIQVVQNHQPKKILDGIEFSERAAINLKLKKKDIMTGQGLIRTGLEPFLWDLKATPIIFSKKRQMLLTYQTNNIGNLYEHEFTNQTGESNGASTIYYGINQLSVSKPTKPPLSNMRWLNNKSHFISANTLFKGGKDVVYRLNAGFRLSSQKELGNKKTAYLTSGDTIFLIENMETRLNSKDLKTEFAIEKNTESIYLKNTLSYNLLLDDNHSQVRNLISDIPQSLNEKYYGVQNHFDSNIKIGRNIYNLSSTFGLSETPQNLQIHSPLFEDIFGGQPYDKLTQKFKEQSYFINNSINFQRQLGRINIRPQLNVFYIKHHINSEIYRDEQIFDQLGFQNDFDWKNLDIDFSLRIRYSWKSWLFSMTNSLKKKDLNIKSATETLSYKGVSDVNWIPSFFIRKKFSDSWEFNGTAKRLMEYSSVNDFTPEFILINYKTIENKNIPVIKTTGYSTSSGISYKNIFDALFLNFNFSFSRNKNDVTLGYNINPDGTIENTTSKEKNFRNFKSFSVTADKYFLSLKTSLKIKTSYSIQNSLLNINSVASPFDSKIFTIDTKIDTPLSSALDFQIFHSFQMVRSNKNRILGNKTIGQVNLNFNADQRLSLIHELGFNNSKQNHLNHSFTDLVYQFSLPKKNIDFSFTLNNLFNKKSFYNFLISDYIFETSYFRLRPRQYLVSVSFGF